MAAVLFRTSLATAVRLAGPAYLLQFVRKIGIKYVPLFYSPRICTAVQKSAFGVWRGKSYEIEE